MADTATEGDKAGTGGEGKATAPEDPNERRVWTAEEDEAIRTLVATYGTKNWSLIAENIIKDYGITGRSGKQCRERWHNHLGTILPENNLNFCVC
jgi:hypothetical protein